MAASSPDIYSDSQPTQKEQKITYTQEELRVIKECRVESFYYRCIPLGTLFSGLAYIGMKHGHLKKSTFAFGGGYAPKMALGVFLGYIFGKMSYYNVCAEKLMKLEDSPLANHIRQRYGRIKDSSHEDSTFYVNRAPEYSMSQDDIPILEDRSPDLSDHIEGADSYSRVTESLSEYSSAEDSDIKSSKPYVSYDDLRRANREEHYNKMTEKYKKSSQGQQRSSQSSDSTFYSQDSQQPLDLRAGSPPPYFDSKKNKYGDVWDD